MGQGIEIQKWIGKTESRDQCSSLEEREGGTRVIWTKEKVGSLIGCKMGRAGRGARLSTVNQRLLACMPCYTASINYPLSG
jgi:hypothetical protein